LTRTADNQFFYYFLGKRLQNQLVAVPIRSDSTTSGRQAITNPVVQSRWDEQIATERVDFVLSLRPPSSELKWMESEPTKYHLLEGRQNDWGLFRVLR
jgi:hypothetical protein